MEHRFKTMQDALSAGYRSVRRGIDTDISGVGSFGYDFEDEKGNRTVTVWFTEEVNRIKQKGAFTPMFPPRKG